MTNELVALDVVRLTSTFTEVYTVPVGTIGFTVAMLHLVNVSAVQSVEVSVCLVPSGGTPQSDNAIFWDFEMPPKGFMELMKGDIWKPGTSIHARVNITGLANLKLAGIKSSP